VMLVADGDEFTMRDASCLLAISVEAVECAVELEPGMSALLFCMKHSDSHSSRPIEL
jgi:hypothetical protein